MHPYRPHPAEPRAVRRRDDRYDDLVLGLLLLAIGGVRVIGALATHEIFAAEPTVALLMIAVAVVLLLGRR